MIISTLQLLNYYDICSKMRMPSIKLRGSKVFERYASGQVMIGG